MRAGRRKQTHGEGSSEDTPHRYMETTSLAQRSILGSRPSHLCTTPGRPQDNSGYTHHTHRHKHHTHRVLQQHFYTVFIIRRNPIMLTFPKHLLQMIWNNYNNIISLNYMWKMYHNSILQCLILDCNLSFFVFKIYFSYFKELQREEETQIAIFHPVVHSTNGYNCQGGSRPELWGA